jgi:acetyl esterase/lipase
MTLRIFLVSLLSCLLYAADPSPILLWPNGAPGSEGKTADDTVRIAPGGDRVVSGVHKPSLTPYLPPKGKGTGAAVIIAPGGGHRELWSDHEGHNIARYLAENGIAGFVLKYRLAREKDSMYTVEGHSMKDGQRAVRLVRARASEFGINPDRIGIMGFSAGGTVAALTGMRFDAGDWQAADPIDRVSSRPAFQALIYPGIPTELKLDKETPPAFLACGENDRQNISQGLPELYLAMKRAGISAELHVYAGVGHGFGVRPTLKGAVSTWLVRFREWLDTIKMTEPSKPVASE